MTFTLLLLLERTWHFRSGTDLKLALTLSETRPVTTAIDGMVVCRCVQVAKGPGVVLGFKPSCRDASGSDAIAHDGRDFKTQRSLAV